ncbi:MAG: urease subunit beta, partial [Nitrospirota bacterium]
MPKKMTRRPTKSQKSRQPAKQSLASIIKAELAKPIIPGEILTASGDIEMFNGREIKELTVKNAADRPIQ